MSTNLIKILNRQRRSKNKKNKFKMSAKSVNSVMLLRLLFYYSIALPRKLSFLCLRIKRRMSRLACRSVKFNFVLVNLNTEVHPGKSVSFSFLLFSRPHTALSLFTCLLFVFFFKLQYFINWNQLGYLSLYVSFSHQRTWSSTSSIMLCFNYIALLRPSFQ